MSYCILSALEYMSREIAKKKCADIMSDAMVIGLNEVQTIWALSVYPFLDELVNFFSVNYAEYKNTGTGNLENNTVIPDSQFPVTFKGSL